MSSLSRPLVIGAMLVALVLPVCVYGQIANSDFETGSYTGWTANSGTAWGPSPADQRRHPHIESWEERYFANSYVNGDGSVNGLTTGIAGP